MYSTVSDVTLGIFRRNSGAGSSFSGIVFCCRQVRLLLVRSTSVAVTASSSSKTSDKTSEDNSFFHGFTRNVSRSKSSVVYGSVSCRCTRPVDPRHKDRGWRPALRCCPVLRHGKCRQSLEPAGIDTALPWALALCVQHPETSPCWLGKHFLRLPQGLSSVFVSGSEQKRTQAACSKWRCRRALLSRWVVL